MYKAVQRRLRDFAERTYNFLDVKKTWTCQETEKINGQVCRARSLALRCLSEDKNNSPSSASSFASSQGNEKCHRERFQYRNNQFTWLSALTCSSALVFGWYATQLLCLQRRNIGWDSRCMAVKFMLQPSRSIHTRFARVALAAPFTTATYDPASRPNPQPKYRLISEGDSGVEDAGSETESEKSSYSPPPIEDDQFLYDLNKFVINEKKAEVIFEPKSTETKVVESSTVETAINDLLSVLGGIEFELGVQSLNAGDFSTAISHLKLATSHHHAGATFNLGICFEQGLGVEKDMRLAMECYTAASELGHPKAMYNLGVFYALGLGGLKKSRRAARRCFVAAAQLGVPEAKIALGIKTPSEEMAAVSSFGAIYHSAPVLVN